MVVDVVAEVKAVAVEDKEEETDHRLPKMVTRPMQTKNKENKEMKAVVAVAEGETAKSALNASKTRIHGSTNITICQE